MTIQLSQNLRRALEEADAGSQPIKLNGPLGNALTEALQQEYGKKEPDEENKPALESQQLDNSAMVKLVSLLTTEEKPQNQSALQVYGVSEAEMTEQDVVNVTNDIASMPLDGRDDYVVVIEESPEGEVAPKAKDLVTAVEAYARAAGCKVYPSLEAFAKARFG